MNGGTGSGSSGPRGWEALRDLQRDVGRLLESIGPLALRAARHFPALNLYESAEDFLITAEVPGLTPEDVEVSLTGEAVTLRGTRRRQDVVPDEAYRRQERPYGVWSRTLTLPGKVDPDRVTASLALGILTVRVRKSEERKPRQIPVTMMGS